MAFSPSDGVAIQYVWMAAVKFFRTENEVEVFQQVEE